MDGDNAWLPPLISGMSGWWRPLPGGQVSLLLQPVKVIGSSAFHAIRFGFVLITVTAKQSVAMLGPNERYELDWLRSSLYESEAEPNLSKECVPKHFQMEVVSLMSLCVGHWV